MTRLSVNLNKIALLRNSRGRDYPNVVEYGKKFIALGVGGITVHPRPDERHATKQDAYDLGRLCRNVGDVEFNIEGYPSEDFLEMVLEIKPDQCTLVPDDASQLTSDHGWNITDSPDTQTRLSAVIKRLKDGGIRTALFIDADEIQIAAAAAVGADRIELYTQMYAEMYAQAHSHGLQNAANEAVFERYRRAAAAAKQAAIGVNAGHDLDLNNLPKFLEIPEILEVSIGHALTMECINDGMKSVIGSYLRICSATDSS